MARWNKEELSRDGRIISYEGTALCRRTDGTWEPFISPEKEVPYPGSLRPYQNPGTGVWSIDRMTGPSPAMVSAYKQPCAYPADSPRHKM